MTGPPTRFGRKNGLGSAALVLALIGLISCWSVLGGFGFGVVAVILGIAGRGRAARGDADNGPVALAGMALGVLAVVTSLVFVVIWWQGWREVGGSDYLDCVMRAGTDRHAVDVCSDTWMTNMEKRFGVTLTPPGPGST